jgi:hypothetical protein
MVGWHGATPRCLAPLAPKPKRELRTLIERDGLKGVTWSSLVRIQARKLPIDSPFFLRGVDTVSGDTVGRRTP